ncbi:MAG: M23 family metallopeptidase [Bacteroidia bacterium]
MAKVKYFFNPNNLTYEQYKPNFWKRFSKVFGFLCTSIIFGILLLLGFYYYFDSPKEKQLKREIEFLSMQNELLGSKVDRLANVLDNLEERDVDIYRVIFEAEPLPRSVRQAGYGGIEKYRSLDGYINSESIVDLHRKIDKLTKQMYIQSKSYDDIAELAKKKVEMLASIPAIQPVSNKDLNRIASGYGYRVHPIYKAVKLHEGLDFSAPQGTEIYATGDGSVADVDRDGRGYGNHVVLDHGFGYQSLYGHMYKVLVKKGQKVKRGELIGLVGNTGLSTAPHLHYEVIKNGKKINPINFFHNDLSPEEYKKVLELANQANQSFD